MTTHRSLTMLAAAAALLIATAAWAERPKLSPGLVARGQSAYAVHCAACHGPRGFGDGEACAALETRPRNFAKDEFRNGRQPAEAFATLSNGLAGTDMRSYAGIDEEERWGLSYYVLILRTAGKNAP